MSWRETGRETTGHRVHDLPVRLVPEARGHDRRGRRAHLKVLLRRGREAGAGGEARGPEWMVAVKYLAEQLRVWLATEDGAAAFRRALDDIATAVAELRAAREADTATIERPMTI